MEAFQAALGGGIPAERFCPVCATCTGRVLTWLTGESPPGDENGRPAWRLPTLPPERGVELLRLLYRHQAPEGGCGSRAADPLLPELRSRGLLELLCTPPAGEGVCPHDAAGRELLALFRPESVTAVGLQQRLRELHRLCRRERERE